MHDSNKPREIDPEKEWKFIETLKPTETDAMLTYPQFGRHAWQPIERITVFDAVVDRVAYLGVRIRASVGEASSLLNLMEEDRIIVSRDNKVCLPQKASELDKEFLRRWASVNESLAEAATIYRSKLRTLHRIGLTLRGQFLEKLKAVIDQPGDTVHLTLVAFSEFGW